MYFCISDGLTNQTYFTFWVFYRQTTFREIKQIRAYDLENLYGNIGGYMGLFFGVCDIERANDGSLFLWINQEKMAR